MDGGFKIMDSLEYITFYINEEKWVGNFIQ